VIGIASVITILSFGLGAREKILKDLNKRGVNVFRVAPRFDPSRMRSGEISHDDIDRVQALGFVSLLVPQMDMLKDVRSRRFVGKGSIKGISAGFIETQGWTLSGGRSLSPLEEGEQSNVCLISKRTARTFYAAMDPLESELYIDGVPWTVIGVYHGADGTADPVFGLLDAEVLIPFRALLRKIKNADIRSIEVHARKDYRGDVAQELLEAVTGNDPARKTLFSVQSQREIVERNFQAQKTLSVTGAIVAAISLIVGGIGMMNVMLTSVLERTREIGIRRAVGARRRDILFQFLIESCLLSGVSAVLGVFLGAAVTFGLPYIIGDKLPAQPQILPTFILLAATSGIFLGVVFGLYPAIKASKLAPGEALRAE
jgi:putative ABC transport system permease protein